MSKASRLRLLCLFLQYGLSVGNLLHSCCYAIINNKTHEFLVPSDLVDQGENDSLYAVASKSSGFASTWRLSQRQVNGELLVAFQNLQSKQFLFTGAHNLLYTSDVPNGASSYYLLPKGVPGGLISQRNAYGGYYEYVRTEKYPGYSHGFVKLGKLIERSYWTFVHRPCIC
uniref:Uncharacterized protein n=1 Tax=Anopheles culicifacies TaxID=139723 RepID=A0A182MM24_9DIPT